MLTLSQIQEHYPENIKGFKKNILREYLQYKILEIIFNSKYANKLCFLGGTALRIIYNSQRFSEDLDFDNFGITPKEFADLSQKIREKLSKEGYETQITNVYKGAFRCNIKLPKILYDNDLSGIKDEKMLIQIDTAPHHFTYTPEKRTLNKFEVFKQIFVTPADILLSQKINAVFNRKRQKGRDFFDIVYLFSFTKPDYKYLVQKLKI